MAKKKMTIKKKEETKIMKLNKQISDLVSERTSLQRDLAYEQGRVKELRIQLEEKEEKMNREWAYIREDRSHNMDEVIFLRELVTLMTVPADRLEEMNKLKEERRMKGGY